MAESAQQTPLTVAANGHVLVPVSVNGAAPLPFVLDSAASSTVITPRLAETLSLTPEPGMMAEVRGASGTERKPVYIIDSFAVGGHRIERRPTVLVEPANASVETYGILGADLLSRTVADFDFPRSILTLHEPGERPADFASVAWTEIACSPVAQSSGGHGGGGALLIVDVMVNGVAAKALVDTGARRTVLNPQLAAALGLSESADGVVPDEDIHGATSHGTQAFKATVASITMDEIGWQNREIAFSALPVFEAIGLGDQPGMILGVNLLKELRLVIDYEGKTLYAAR